MRIVKISHIFLITSINNNTAVTSKSETALCNDIVYVSNYGELTMLK